MTQYPLNSTVDQRVNIVSVKTILLTIANSPPPLHSSSSSPVLLYFFISRLHFPAFFSLQGAHAKGLEAISTDLAAPNAGDNVAGTFTITDVGGQGARGLAGIVPPPQACMLGLGAVQQVVVPDDSGAVAEEGAGVPYKLVSRMSVTLSCDHRVVDGAVGAQWLKEFKGSVESPSTLLL